MLKSLSFLRCLSMSSRLFVHSSLSITVVGSSFSLWSTKGKGESTNTRHKIIKIKKKVLWIKDGHRMNYFEGVPLITYNYQVALSIPVPSSRSRDLLKVKKINVVSKLYEGISTFIQYQIFPFRQRVRIKA